jgi:predicted DNA-binding transcriptional regulator AlpA
MVFQMNEARAAGGARRMLTLGQVLELVPVSESTLRRMIKRDGFPGPHLISPKKLIWYEDEVERWQEALPAAEAKKRRKAE